MLTGLRVTCTQNQTTTATVACNATLELQADSRLRITVTTVKVGDFQVQLSSTLHANDSRLFGGYSYEIGTSLCGELR